MITTVVKSTRYRRPLVVAAMRTAPHWMWWCRRCSKPGGYGEATSADAANTEARAHWARCPKNPASLPSIMAVITEPRRLQVGDRVIVTSEGRDRFGLIHAVGRMGVIYNHESNTPYCSEGHIQVKWDDRGRDNMPLESSLTAYVPIEPGESVAEGELLVLLELPSWASADTDYGSVGTGTVGPAHVTALGFVNIIGGLAGGQTGLHRQRYGRVLTSTPQLHEALEEAVMSA